MQVEEEMVQCPYDKSHMILKSRIQVHLKRCRPNYKDVPKLTCPFSVSHLVDSEKLDDHVKTCSQRGTFEVHRRRDQPPASASKEAAPTLPDIECSENWDDAPHVSSYNPLNYVSTAPVLRNPQGMPPSEKKKFRGKERIRLIELNENKTDKK